MVNDGIRWAERYTVAAQVAATFIGLRDDYVALLHKAKRTPESTDAAIITFILVD